MSASSLGLQGILVREFVLNKDNMARVISSALSARLAFGLFSAALTLVVMMKLESSSLILIVIISFGLVFNAFEVFDLYFQAEGRSDVGAKIRLVCLVVFAIAKLLIVIFSSSLILLACAYALEYVGIGLYLYRHYRFKRPSLVKPQFAVMKGLISKSWPLILSGFGMMVYVKVDQIMVESYLGSASVGHYAVAAQLSEVWWFIPNAIMTVLFPIILTARQGGGTKWQEIMNLLFLVGFGTCLAVYLMSNYLVPLLYGEEYAETISILQVYIWSTLFVFLRAGVSKWIIAEELYTLSLISHLLGAFFNVFLNILLIPMWGTEGAAFATLLSYAISGFGFLLIRKKTRHLAKKQIFAVLNMPKTLMLLLSCFVYGKKLTF